MFRTRRGRLGLDDRSRSTEKTADRDTYEIKVEELRATTAEDKVSSRRSRPFREANQQRWNQQFSSKKEYREVHSSVGAVS